jgi:putative serine protease PepD
MTEADPWLPVGGVSPARAHAWGYPTGPVGSWTPPAPRRTPGTVALVLLTALLAGTVGGVVGARTADPEVPSASSLRDPGASLGDPVPVVPVSRPATSVAGIASRVLRSVVSIEVDDATGHGTGSGVVLTRDGFVLTNNHVVEAAGNGTITVSFNDSEQVDLPARVVGRDPETDLAVIRAVGAGDLTPARLGTSSDLVVGDPVVAVGSPLGLAGTVTSGIISALNRTVNVPAETGQTPSPLFNAIQTDAAINPGNSGGPLVDGAGRVIGINSAIASLGASALEGQSGSIGVGFAIPIDEARSIAEQLMRTGRATHPVIGVSALTVGADGNGPRGARIKELLPNGPAQGAGLRVGDVIVKVDDDRVVSVDQLITALRRHDVGESVRLTFVRGSSTRTARVVLEDKRAS